ncbi:hypothetical protein [Alphaentomopoxvirus acuprea]|uniref:Uncharacterized protein n=1 Tax=Alphaentomopoxvirus acuprea TaxID=62099 RepID=W6JIX9_9POXV|nr:hypothetical protein BA82_gp162 [Anomala cuprea entomopoxvirus]BAO49522.1 hypothetical protein [Anomala cuprea entomopoxvirus]
MGANMLKLSLTIFMIICIDYSITGRVIVNRNNKVSSKMHTPPSVKKIPPCGWAIINCCVPGSNSVNHNCFERMGCPGPFWDSSPCDNVYVKYAIKLALNYYA